MPVLLVSGLCGTWAPGLEWVTEQSPAVWTVTSRFLLLLTQGKVGQGLAAWEYDSSLHTWFLPHTRLFHVVLRQHEGQEWQRKCV